MNEPIVMPKRPVRAAVTLFGGRKTSGDFFLDHAERSHSGPQTLLDLLNSDSRSFVPFHSDDGTLLLHRVAIRMVEFDSPELMEIFTKPDNGYIYALKIVLRTESKELALQGFCYTGELHPESRRPVDLLNSRDMFLMFYSTGRLILINKNAISHADVD